MTLTAENKKKLMEEVYRSGMILDAMVGRVVARRAGIDELTPVDVLDVLEEMGSGRVSWLTEVLPPDDSAVVEWIANAEEVLSSELLSVRGGEKLKERINKVRTNGKYGGYRILG